MHGVEIGMKERLLANTTVNNLIGNSVYIGRIPKDAPQTIIMITRQGTNREYSTDRGEDNWAMALISFDIMSRTEGAIGLVYRLADLSRRLFSGYFGTLNGIYMPGILIDNDSYVATGPGDKSDNWIHDYIIDFRVPYVQQPAFEALN